MKTARKKQNALGPVVGRLWSGGAELTGTVFCLTFGWTQRPRVFLIRCGSVANVRPLASGGGRLRRGNAARQIVVHRRHAARRNRPLMPRYCLHRARHYTVTPAWWRPGDSLSGGSQVQIVFSGRHADITESMRTYAEEKAQKLLKYYDKIQEIEVVADRESALYRVEIIVNAEHKNMFVASETDEDFYAATDLMVDKISRQLTRHKEKHRNRKHPDKHADRVEPS
jgi:putative sigma-54 modulation protein